MKPAIIPHATHKRLLRARLDTLFPDKSMIPKEIAPIYRKFRDLDLSAVDCIMQPHYSTVGPKPWSPSILLRALLVMIAYKCTTITRWVTQLRITPILAIICGFDPTHVPGVGTFYDFMSRLWDLPTDNYSEHVKQPQKKKLKKPKVKGQKADSVESETVAELIARLSQKSFRIEDEAYYTLYKIFRTCFLDRSIASGPLPVSVPIALVIAGNVESMIAPVIAFSRSPIAILDGILPEKYGTSAMTCTSLPILNVTFRCLLSFIPLPNMTPMGSARLSSAISPSLPI